MFSFKNSHRSLLACLILSIWNPLLVFAEEPKSKLLLRRSGPIDPSSNHDGHSSLKPERYRETDTYNASISNASTDPNLPSFLLSLKGKKFKRITIDSTKLSEAQANALEGIETEQLTISNCDVSDEVAQSLGRIQVASSLTFIQLRMSDQAWTSLGRIACTSVTLSRLQMSDLGLSGFLSGKSRMKVEASAIRGCTADGWRALSSMADLDDLQLRDCDFDDQALLHLSNSKCRRLHVKNGQITGSTLGALKTLKECIQSLSLSGCPINDQGVQSIGEFSKLGTLDLSKTLVTDNGLKSLSEFSKLNELNISGTAVTDDGFRTFKVSPDLISINAARTKVSQAWAIEISRQYQTQNKTISPQSLTVGFYGDPRWPPHGGCCMKGEFHLYK